MKKTLAAAITSALVIGAASTTFAAANPFSDVPADHWSYDAVAELAQEGIVDGYGDGTFRGDRAITRYEMAQIVAKAMTKDVNGDAKATLDKLAAEYADELNNLGVRVDALEKKVDNTKFNGELRLRYDETKQWDQSSVEKDKGYKGLFRLETTSQVNDSWVVKSRMDANYKLDDGHDGDFKLKRAYAQGSLFGATAKLGRFGHNIANGMIWGDEITGASFDWQVGKTDVNIFAASLDDNGITDSKDYKDPDAEIAGIQVGYDFTDKFGMNAGYYEVRSNAMYNNGAGASDTNAIWSVGAKYAFNDNVAMDATYAKSDLDDKYMTFAGGDDADDAYAVNVQYKGANKADKGSFGVNLGYYDLASSVALDPTWDASDFGVKGWRIGADYTVAENIVWSTWYFDGDNKKAQTGEDDEYKKLRTQVEFFF